MIDLIDHKSEVTVTRSLFCFIHVELSVSIVQMYMLGDVFFRQSFSSSIMIGSFGFDSTAA